MFEPNSTLIRMAVGFSNTLKRACRAQHLPEANQRYRQSDSLPSWKSQPQDTPTSQHIRMRFDGRRWVFSTKLHIKGVD